MPRCVVIMFAAAALTLMGHFPSAYAGVTSVWEVDLSVSRVGFVARQTGSPVPGRFEQFSADIRFDPNALDTSAIRVEIVIASVATENAERDDVIRSKEMFDTATWPTALFEADSFDRTDENGSYIAHGRLTLRDVTRDVDLPFTLTIVPHPDTPDLLLARVAGALDILRIDYGVGQGPWRDTSMVANEVTIEIEIAATQPAGD
jgi:polyisoprenoid-binding protein YceI